MANLFTGSNTRDDDVISEHGDDNTAPGNAGAKKSAYGGAAIKSDTAGKVLRGSGAVLRDPRLYRYNVVLGSTSGISYEVTRDDRMSAEQAGAMLHSIHVMFGIDRENEDLLFAFDDALWFCHTVNSGSVLVPGRSKFSLPGHTHEFDFKTVMDKLGVQARRFFRAYANDIIQANRKVLRDYNPYDPVSEEKWGWLQQVAHSRGLHRFPELAHDSAEASTKLTTVERSALAESKKSVIGATTNSADKLRANDRIMSADGYDSTVGNNV